MFHCSHFTRPWIERKSPVRCYFRVQILQAILSLEHLGCRGPPRCRKCPVPPAVPLRGMVNVCISAVSAAVYLSCGYYCISCISLYQCCISCITFLKRKLLCCISCISSVSWDTHDITVLMLYQLWPSLCQPHSPSHTFLFDSPHTMHHPLLLR